MFKPQRELGIKHTIKLSHPGKTVYLTYFLFLVHVQTCFFFSSSSVVTSNLKFYVLSCFLSCHLIINDVQAT